MAEIVKEMITLPETTCKVDETMEKKYGNIDIKRITFKNTWVFWESMKQERGNKES